MSTAKLPGGRCRTGGPAAIVALLAIAACGGEAAPFEGPAVVLLGTGTPNADPVRSGPSVAIVAGDRSYLVDAGPGVVRRAAAAAARHGIPALEARRLERVFLTHLHSDHTVGLPDLMLTPWVLERSVPLEVWGPPGIAEMLEHLAQAYQADIRRRIDGLQPQNPTGWRTVVHEVRAGVVYADDHVTVSAVPVDHEDWEHAFGYRFETAAGVVVISGDARPSESLVAACARCDILVHEVYSDRGFAERSPDWQRYHASAHTAARALGDLAGRAGPRLLVLYHQLFWGTAEDELVAEVRATYDGAVVSGKDLDVFKLAGHSGDN